MKKIYNIRREYSFSHLKNENLNPNPYLQFNNWFNEAINSMGSDLLDANAFTLSTVDKNGYPDSRIVLLKDLKYNGFCVFTNFQSKKGRQLERLPFASLNFYWEKLERQVTIKCKAEKLKEDDAKTYFSSRPRESQIAALISNQSEVIENKNILLSLFEKEKEKWKEEKKIPKPNYWGGFLFIGFEYTFWQGGNARLHDVFRYRKNDSKTNTWKIERLSP